MSYNITDYSYNQAKKLGVEIYPSHNPRKKIDIFKGKFICSIGDSRYKDFPTYMMERGLLYAENRRRLYRLRHQKDIARVGSAGYWASNLLW